MKFPIKVRVLWLLTILFFGVGAMGSMASDDTPINATSWINHPKIKEIRELCNEIEGNIKIKNLVEHKRDLKREETHGITFKAIYLDKLNIARKYVERSGSEDSALTFSYYYDPKRVLRFVFIEGGAVNGSQMEHRIYFGASGERIWEIQKYQKGPGYSFPTVWLEEDLVFDPLNNFNTK